MCIRIGIDWKNDDSPDHRWRGWQACDHAREHGIACDICPKRDQGQTSPHTELENLRAKHAKLFLRLQWCSSTRGCQDDIDKYARAAQSERDKIDPVKNAKGLLVDPEGVRKAQNAFYAAQTRYVRVLSRHIWSCLPGITLHGRGKVATMRRDMYEGPEQRVFISINEELLGNSAQKKLLNELLAFLTRNGHSEPAGKPGETRLDSVLMRYQEILEHNGKAQWVDRPSYQQYRMLKQYVMDNFEAMPVKWKVNPYIPPNPEDQALAELLAPVVKWNQAHPWPSQG